MCSCFSHDLGSVDSDDFTLPQHVQEGARNSVTHNVTVIANGLMHFGTTSDVFLRENLDWLKRASNWAKFTATASLGLIHYVCVRVGVWVWGSGCGECRMVSSFMFQSVWEH